MNNGSTSCGVPPLQHRPFAQNGGGPAEKAADAITVRDAILATFAEARSTSVSPDRLADAVANARYSLARQMDDTESIAGALARYVRFRRSVETLNNYFRLLDSLTPADLQTTAKKYFTEARMVVTTLSKDPLPENMRKLPALASFESPSNNLPELPFVVQKSALPLLNIKRVFHAGSAFDPLERRACYAAKMLAQAGSKSMAIDDIERALFPMAGSFLAKVDKELVTFTGVIHRDNAARFLDIVLPQLIEPGFRENDFARLKAQQLNALQVDLRNNNEEELAKERLQVTFSPAVSTLTRPWGPWPVWKRSPSMMSRLSSGRISSTPA